MWLLRLPWPIYRSAMSMLSFVCGCYDFHGLYRSAMSMLSSYVVATTSMAYIDKLYLC